MEPKLFTVSAVEVPTTKAKEAGAVDRIILPGTDVLALSMAGAAAAATKAIKAAEWDPSRTKWFIREFKNEAN